MRKNTDQKNSEYGYFSHSVNNIFQKRIIFAKSSIWDVWLIVLQKRRTNIWPNLFHSIGGWKTFSNHKLWNFCLDLQSLYHNSWFSLKIIASTRHSSSEHEYMVLEIQFRTLKCTAVTRVHKSDMGRLQYVDVNKFLNVFTLYIHIQIVWHINYCVFDK